MLPDSHSQQVPETFDDYFAGVVRLAIRYVTPTGAGLYLLYFGWDLLFIRSARQGIITLLLRLAGALLVLTAWFAEPRIRSLRKLEWTLGSVYFFALLDLTLILVVIPGGLTIGVAGLMLVVMLGGGMFCQRPFPVGIAGALGTLAVGVACYLNGLAFREIANAVIFVGSGCMASVVFAFFTHRGLRQRHALALSLEKQKQQSEALLKEILPRYVIQRIRDGAESIAESISEVNIIFIDIVGFTAMSRKLAPNHLLEILGETFRSLDSQCERFGVTKIKTIGDAYMAATGAPEPSSLSALAAVEFCLAAIQSVDAITHQTGIPFQIRAGIATGAVISGVLSLKRPAYDLWGETVNLASRMEHTGEPGAVQIAETTYWRVKDRFVCTPRGLVDVKGFGQVQTYLITARSTENTSPNSSARRRSRALRTLRKP